MRSGVEALGRIGLALRDWRARCGRFLWVRDVPRRAWTSAVRSLGAGVTVAAMSLCGSTSLLAQGGKNLIPNGGFERVLNFENLYDGVDQHGDIRVPPCGGPVYLSGSVLSVIKFSPSVAFADVNNDQLPDLVVASPLGLLYWYKNIGKKGEPAFATGTLVQTYLGTAPRIFVTDWNGDGNRDILFGNIKGEINILFNQGSIGDPIWAKAGKPRWFPPLPSEPIQVGYDTPVLRGPGGPLSVGVYSAPVLVDWNRDGIPDLISGEGSYSANSIKIWINSGTLANPVFPERPAVLAYGDGREQLTPSVYDWDSDGILDLIVGDREGHMALYLGNEKSYSDPKQVQPIEFTQFIKFGDDEKFEATLVSPFVCDYNEDGLPDLLYGNSTGEVLVAFGKGKRDHPQFVESENIKSTDAAKDFKQPSAWENNLLFKAWEGQPYYGTAPLPEAVFFEKKPPPPPSSDGTPPPPENPELLPKEGERAFHLSWYDKFWGWEILKVAPENRPTYTEGVYVMRSQVLPFVMGREYELSFWRKGTQMNIHVEILYEERITDPKNPKGPPIVPKAQQYVDKVTCGATWTPYSKIFRLLGSKAKDYDTNGKSMEHANLTLTLYGTGDVWLDDIRLVEVEK